MISKNLVLTIYTKESGINEAVLDLKTTDDNELIILESKAPKIALTREQLKTALDDIAQFLQYYPRSNKENPSKDISDMMNVSFNLDDEGL